MPSSPYLTNSPLTLNPNLIAQPAHSHGAAAVSPGGSMVDNFISKAESFAGTPGHGLLQGKVRSRGAAVYHSASSILGHNHGMMGFGMGMGSIAATGSAPLPFPSASTYYGVV